MKEYIDITGTPLKEGVIELLDFLDNLNINVSIATSRGLLMTNYYLENSKINKRFDYVLTGDLIEKGKPEPDIFIEVAKYFNVNSSNCLVIEDSINGVFAALNANMNVIMIPDLVEPSDEIKNRNVKVFESLKDIKSEWNKI